MKRDNKNKIITGLIIITVLLMQFFSYGDFRFLEGCEQRLWEADNPLRSEGLLPLDSTPPQPLQAERGNTTGGGSGVSQVGSEDRKDDTPHYDTETQSGGGGSCTDGCN